MKKTLVAVASLATIAAASSAMAQVTLSGAVDARYQSYSGTGSTSVDGAGMLVSDATFKLSVSEDLGGGLKASAWINVDGATSDGGAMTGDGVYLGLSGGFGTVSFSNVEGGDYLPIDLVTKNALGGNGGVADRLSWSSPSMMGATIVLTHSDGRSGAQQTGDSVNNLNSYELYYVNGPFSADIGTIQANAGGTAGYKNTNRFKASYNFGVAALTYGQVNGGTVANGDIKETGITLSAPLTPAVTVTGQYVTSKIGTANATKGNAFAVSYALSPRTSVTAEMVKYDVSTSVTGASRNRVTLSHKF